MKDNPLVYLFSKTWRYSQGNRHKVVWYWLMFIVAISLELSCKPLIFARVIDIAQKRAITWDTLILISKLMGLTLVIEIVFWALHGPGRCLERNNAFGVRVNYRKFLLRGVMTLPMEWHVEHHSGDTIDKIEKGTNALYSFAEDSFEVIYSLARLIISYAVLVYFSVPAAFIVVGMLGLSGWITIRFDRILIGQYRELSWSENKISESVFDAISNIATVIILRVEKLVFTAIMHKVQKPADLFRYNQRLSEEKWGLTSICTTVTAIIVTIVYFWQHLGTPQGVLVSQVYLLFRYLDNVGEVFFRFTSLYGDLVKNKARTMNAEELSKDFISESFANHVLPADWQVLSIRNLNFSYHKEGDDYTHLENVFLDIVRGQRIAFVGPTGAGKTTLLKIIRDLYHPRTGELLVDGDIVPDGFAGISRAIALVPQDPEIFASTILENITLGAEYDMEFVRRFTDMACFTGVAENLPQKFASLTKEKGVNLSGGEKQRLALARGLLACHDKDIVLLDEPTSSLDTATERTVYRNIFQAFPDKTIISSIHRLHLLPLFDKVYMFSGGKIVASGTLNELVRTCSEFQDLWRQYHEAKQDAAS